MSSRKRKKKYEVKQRNFLVPLAQFRKAGKHVKSNKAIRKLERQKPFSDD